MMSFLSFGILLRTLFEPWKQITQYAGPGSSFDIKFRVLLDNLFARAFGFVIRSGVLIFGAIATILTALFSLFAAVIWPAIPLLPFIFVLAGIWMAGS